MPLIKIVMSLAMMRVALTPQASEGIATLLGLTFGVGHHSCPGRELAAGLVRTEKQGAMRHRLV